MKEFIRKELNYEGKIIFTEHHESHAASAFYPSPFEEAAILTMDGVGEWTTTNFGTGRNNKIELLADIKFPHSLRLLYSAFTYYTGFKVNSGEYKVMGLAPYGEPKYKDLILQELLDVKEDGSFRMNMDYFDYAFGLTMTNHKLEKLFGGLPRQAMPGVPWEQLLWAGIIILINQELLIKMIHKKAIPQTISGLIAQEKVIGWFQGRMEFGPRALGARSIIGDARSPKMKAQMNLKIKFRESFRPFAPSVLADKVSEYFEMKAESPYMLLVADVKKERRKQMTDAEIKLFGIEKLNVLRSDIPAVTHIDYSARIQTVHERINKLYHDLIKKFDENYGCGVIINTSFNVRGEPIVCTPEDAFRCFMRTQIDYLVMGNYLLDKKDQKKLEEDKDWQKEFQLD